MFTHRAPCVTPSQPRVPRSLCAPSVVHHPSCTLSDVVCTVYTTHRVRRPSRTPSVVFTVRRVYHPSRRPSVATLSVVFTIRGVHRPSESWSPSVAYTVRRGPRRWLSCAPMKRLPFDVRTVRFRVHRPSAFVYTVRPSSRTPSVIHTYSPL